MNLIKRSRNNYFLRFVHGFDLELGPDVLSVPIHGEYTYNCMHTIVSAAVVLKPNTTCVTAERINVIKTPDLEIDTTLPINRYIYIEYLWVQNYFLNILTTLLFF